MPKPSPLPPAFASEPFTVRAALDSGISPRRLRASDLQIPFRGVRSPTAISSVSERAHAYAARMPDGGFFSHETALLLYGTPLPARMERSPLVDVAVVAPRYPPQMAGVRGHRLFTSVTVDERAGLPVITASQAWCQLAARLSPIELVIAGDHLVRRKGPASSAAALGVAVARMGSGRGVRAAREALSLVRPGTDSPRETVLRLLILEAGLPEPVIGFAVHHRGAFIATPDLAYVREKIAIEYEGEVHRTNPRVYEDDIIRRELLEEAGWLVIRVTKDHLASRPDWLLGRIAGALRARSQ